MTLENQMQVFMKKPIKFSKKEFDKKMFFLKKRTEAHDRFSHSGENLRSVLTCSGTSQPEVGSHM
jgi:hypothetical protein